MRCRLRVAMSWGVMLILAFSAKAQADALVAYTNRADWVADVGSPTGVEDFSGFAADTSFRGSTVALDGMTIVANPNEYVTGGNSVDVAPFFAGNSLTVDGSTYAATNVLKSQTGPWIQFDQPVTAWGAKFKSAGDAAGVSIGVYDSADNLLGELTLEGIATGTVAFRGFALPDWALADHLVFNALDGPSTNDYFGMDDLEYVTQPIPEPGTLALLGLGVLGLFWAGRRRRAA